MDKRKMNRERMLVRLQTYLVNIGILGKGQVVWEISWCADDGYEDNGKGLHIGIAGKKEVRIHENS
jgi:hypothetical protein